ncbi:MAG: 16S rRNA (guanine(527)-N(7))-methyltransferase RsmG [Cyanobacteria bacterium RU_5_0]|nr:16S rRNA (guanine(527)-N(7))-methyltransferase RsmG [Cyanobacteria bacterium RU_5_0]
MKDEGVSVLPRMDQVWWETLGWQPDSTQQAKFQRLYALILQGNRQLNLTRITGPEEFWEKHLWDSLSGIKSFLKDVACSPEGVGRRMKDETLPSPPPSLNVIDIGTGAGFPGVPVAIALPTWTVTLLDATRKKIAFLDTLLTDLEIGNMRTVCDRAEQIGHNPQYRGKFDLALIRAVASASVCAEYALPLLKVGGVAVLYRGRWTEAEAMPLQSALEVLGSKLEATEEWTTPLSQSDRHCLYLRKIEPTKITFPRSIGLPTQKPL